MAKTLSESAAEILQASIKAGKEPMIPNGAQINDLGGATPTDDYSGPTQGEHDEDTSVGELAAAAIKQSPRPGMDTPYDDKAGNPQGTGAGGLRGDIPAPAKTTPIVPVKVSEADQKNDWVKGKVKQFMGSMSEDVDALFNGESLSEEFRTKATTIFEAAVQSRVEAIVEDVLAENDSVLEEAVESVKVDLAEQIDSYLNYVVEEWINENQVAIERGLRAELSEEFISGLKDLFERHYIDIPESKVDIAEELAAKVVELEEEFEQLIESSEAVLTELNESKKNEAIRKVCDGLTEVQIGKMKSLAESVEFTTEGEFETKLAVIRENYFPTKNRVNSGSKLIKEAIETDDQPEVEAHGLMKHYVNAITKTAPK